MAESKKVNIGVVYPQTEFGNDPVAIRDYAQSAEGMGFSHILAYDHVLGANPLRPEGWKGPYTYKSAFQEIFILFSYMAACTTKIKFASGVIILPQRQTALVAKQAASLDLLSGGRLRLGVGLGWNSVEYVALGQDFHTRGRRIEEQVELMRQLWSQPLVTFDGNWHKIPDAGINPLPVQRPIPIWFGGRAKPALRRAARLGDGWISNHSNANQAKESIDLIFHHLDIIGHQRSTFGIEAILPYGSGDRDIWESHIQGWLEVGATHFSFNTMGRGFDTPSKHLAALQKFAIALGIDK
jgi:probable F420-dependent oxidoreductase